MNKSIDYARLYTARRRNLRVSPRKLRLAANLIRGKTVQQATDSLSFSVTKSAHVMGKILHSAFANAEAADVELDKLIVSAVSVNKGIIIKRRLPSGRGRMRANYHRFSHVDLYLAEKPSKRAIAAAKAKSTAKLKDKVSAKVAKQPVAQHAADTLPIAIDDGKTVQEHS